MSLRINEKADSFCQYDLFECRSRKSNLKEIRHQQEAIYATQKWFESKNYPAGTILALPTGSGKTFTAVRFLAKYPLSQGYKVLWLAHTHHLLEQAFFSFGPGKMDSKARYEVGWISEPKEKLDVRVVSGSSNHSNVNDIKKTDDVLITTLQTINRAYNNVTKRKKLLDFFESSKGKLIVIFDEAHHAPAPSYRKMLIGDADDPEVPESIRELFPEMYLLGLTATPTYTDDKKRGWLIDIFPQKIINSDTKKFHSSISDLIIEDILAKPNIVEIPTTCDAELDDREYQMLVKRTNKDIPERIIKRLADKRERNQIIANNYDKKIYGKTIIFTDYIDQCEQINTFLQDRNKELSDSDAIKSDVMYSARSNEENEQVLQNFRDDKLDVLVNIRMLTEGTDVPDVNSVFITRQTTSEILLTQMVGRALRGPKFNGTEIANLVFFIDNWKQLINWATWDPNTWSGKEESPTPPPVPWDLISVSLIRQAIRILGGGGKNKGKYLNYVPIGWYVVDYYDLTEDDETNKITDENEPLKVRDFVLVFENNKDNYLHLIKYLSKSDINRFNNEKIKYNDCKDDLQKIMEKSFPQPDENIGKGLKKNIFNITRHMAQNKKAVPQFVPFKERKEYDMDALAHKFMKFDRSTENQKLKEIYYDSEKLWKTLYYDFDHFKTQYNACVEYLLSKKDPEPISPIEASAEEKLANILKVGYPKEKISALKRLCEIGTQEYLHQTTIDLILNIIETESDETSKETAINTFNIIKRDITLKERKDILKRDGYKCLCCGETRFLQVDHIIPKSLGGSNSPDNLQTLCARCNGGLKSEEIVDFRLQKTPLSKKPDNKMYGLSNKHITKQQASSPEFWEKVIKRNINLFYRCSAVKTIKRDNFQWNIELYNGNNKRWAENSLNDLIKEINSILNDYKILFLKNIDFKLLKSKYATNIPNEYRKLWNKYVRHSGLLNDKEKDKLAEYTKNYGLPEN